VKLFLPSHRQINWLLVAGFSAVGYALYVRYLAIEPAAVGRACEEGLRTWLCNSRSVAIQLFTHNMLGGTALLAALLNLLRPSMILLMVALVAAGMGIVLYNVTASAIAVGLLLLSLARRAPE